MVRCHIPVVTCIRVIGWRIRKKAMESSNIRMVIGTKESGKVDSLFRSSMFECNVCPSVLLNELGDLREGKGKMIFLAETFLEEYYEGDFLNDKKHG